MASFKTYQDYIKHVVDQVGSDITVAKRLGFADGSRVGLWQRGTGRPDELNVVKIARSRGDDPIAMLHLAGYTEIADPLKGTIGPTPVEFDIRVRTWSGCRR